MRYAAIVAILSGALSVGPFQAFCKASSPTGWSPVVVPTGTYRSAIKSMPVHRRPGRLLHVYGNTVRLIEQSRLGYPTRPVRQILIGTPNPLSEIADRR